MREATKKSDVVRLNRSPQMPMPDREHRHHEDGDGSEGVAHRRAHDLSTTSVKARSLRSAARTYHQPIASSVG